MIQSWNGDTAREILEGKVPRGVHADVARAARRRLTQLHAAARVEDMRDPPGNRLHKIGDETWSISVNMQYRITFTWGPSGPEDVWFGDYH